MEASKSAPELKTPRKSMARSSTRKSTAVVKLTKAKGKKSMIKKVANASNRLASGQSARRPRRCESRTAGRARARARAP